MNYNIFDISQHNIKNMTDYPIFLLPKDDHMITAKIEGNEIKILKKTTFPSGSRYAISNQGIAACIDQESKLIIYGQLNETGDFKYIKNLPFPNTINPTSLCIINNNIIFGGEEKHAICNNINSYGLVISYSITNDKSLILNMPKQLHCSSIDELLVDNNRILAIDNFISPKHIVEYDFSNPEFPHLLNTYNLHFNDEPISSVKKGCINKDFFLLFSSTLGEKGIKNYINIYKKNNYNNYIGLSQCFNLNNIELGKIHSWRDIFLVPNKDLLLITSNTGDLGVYFIDNNQIEKQINNIPNSVCYIRQWDKKLIKIISAPNDTEKIIFIYEEYENINYSYEDYYIDDIIYYYELTINFEKSYDNFKNREQDIESDNFEENNWEKDYFDAMTDGQMGDYDDFSGDIDDVDRWSRG